MKNLIDKINPIHSRLRRKIKRAEEKIPKLEEELLQLKEKYKGMKGRIKKSDKKKDKRIKTE